MDYAKESLRLHGEWKGKIEVISKVPVATKEDLSLAYTPGVAQPCLEIQKDVNKSYELTRRHNLCAVITDGSAVLRRRSPDNPGCRKRRSPAWRRRPAGWPNGDRLRCRNRSRCRSRW